MTALDPATIAALLKKDDERKKPVSNIPQREGMVWCEFCKGYYIEEYHYGDMNGD